MNSGGRKLSAAVVTVLASAVLLLTVVAHYASLADAASFSGRAVSVVRAGPVRSLITHNISSRLGAVVGDHGSAQPVIEQGVNEALSNPQVAAEVRAAAASLQSQLLSGHATSLTLALPEVGPAIAAAIQSRSPGLAAEVERIGTITVVDVRIPPSAAQAVNDLAYLGRDATLLIVLTLALGALALLISPDRRRTLIGLGLGAVVSGLVAAAAYIAGRALVIGGFSSQDAQTAAGVVWSVYLGGLEPLGFVIAGAGTAVAAAAALFRTPRRDTWDYHDAEPLWSAQSR